MKGVPQVLSQRYPQQNDSRTLHLSSSLTVLTCLLCAVVLLLSPMTCSGGDEKEDDGWLSTHADGQCKGNSNHCNITAPSAALQATPLLLPLSISSSTCVHPLCSAVW